jgi:hypothetical protein
MKNLIYPIFLIVFSSVALADPFELPMLDKLSGIEKNIMEFDPLSNYALRCMYDKEWLDMDVDIQVGTTIREKSSQYMTSPNQYQNNFAGLVLRIPLFSGKELERERHRTIDRKTDIINNARVVIEGVEKVLHNRRMLSIYTTVEKRSRKRVMAGVAPLDEQIVVLEKISGLKKQLISDTAEVLSNRKMLLAKCKEGDDKKLLQGYLGRLEEMGIK